MFQSRHLCQDLTTEVSDVIAFIENVYRQFQVVLFHPLAPMDQLQETPVRGERGT